MKKLFIICFMLFTFGCATAPDFSCTTDFDCANAVGYADFEIEEATK